MNSATNSNASQTGRVPVLVVVNHDGHLEIYGDRKRVDVHVAQKLEVPEVPEHEQLAESILENDLPPRHKPLYWPGQIICRANVITVTPSMELSRQWYVSVSEAIDRNTIAEDDEEWIL